jgi:hypothetical protein
VEAQDELYLVLADDTQSSDEEDKQASTCTQQTAQSDGQTSGFTRPLPTKRKHYGSFETSLLNILSRTRKPQAQEADHERMFLLFLLSSFKSLSRDQKMSAQIRFIRTARWLSQRRHSQIQTSKPTAQQKKTPLSMNARSALVPVETQHTAHAHPRPAVTN